MSERQYPGIPGSSYSLLAFYLLATAASCFLIGGILPMVVLLAGLAMSIRKSDLRHLLNSSRFITWFYGTAAVVSLLVALSHVASLSSAGLLTLTTVEHQYFLRFFGLAAVLSTIGWAVTKFALLPAFEPYSRSVAAHGFWARQDAANPHNRLAAELAKWGELRKDGAVTGEDLNATQPAGTRAAA